MTVLDDRARQMMQQIMETDAALDARLNQVLRLLSKWRSQKLANTLAAREGRVIRAGPFAGMAYGNATEGALAARLLGCYETSLVPVIEEIIRTRYARIIDVGCAEGYYAVGLAMRMLGAQVHAHDADPAAREHCTALARLNGVEDRVHVGGALDHGSFDDCAARRTVVICDIEGAELDLLDPGKAPGLAVADILVECHDLGATSISRTLTQRFQATHRVRMFGRKLNPEVLPDWTESLSDLDRLLFLWEWRGGPTPWLWMTAREHPATEEATP